MKTFTNIVNRTIPVPGFAAAALLASLAVPHLAVASADSAVISLCTAPQGCSASAPVVVTPTHGAFVFNAPTSGLWFDPPFIDGFIYDLTGATFASLVTPPAPFGFGPVELFVGTSDLGTIAPGAGATLPSGTTEFELIGINPLIDEASGTWFTAYPVQLFFNGTATSLTITPVTVPEPISGALLAAALGGLAFARRGQAGRRMI